MKRCVKCKTEKSESEFNQNRTTTDGLARVCRTCNQKTMKAWSDKNREKKRQVDRDYYHSHKQEHREYKRKWRADNREHKRRKNKEWVAANPDKMAAIIRRWKDRNPDKMKAQRDRQSLRRRNIPSYRLRHAVSQAVRDSLKYGKHGRGWERLVGYTLIELVAHLDSLLQPGMNWTNYGFGEGKWTIDHKKPVHLFLIEGPESPGFQNCWALDNLQPMWFVHNCRKSGKYV